MTMRALRKVAKLLVPARFRSSLRAAIDWRGRLEFAKARLQSRTASYLRHDTQYRDPGALAYEAEATRRQYDVDAANSGEFNLGAVIDTHPQLKIAVDIGSGVGWLSGWLAERFEKVISIEPSLAAVTIARDLQKDHADRIAWFIGLADTELFKLTLSEPTLFVTGRVLTHLPDREVKKILRAVDAIAPKGSVMVLAELWGTPSSGWLWHIRSREWWTDVVGDRWQMEFLDHSIQAPGRFVGLRATCVQELRRD